MPPSADVANADLPEMFLLLCALREPLRPAEDSHSFERPVPTPDEIASMRSAGTAPPIVAIQIARGRHARLSETLSCESCLTNGLDTRWASSVVKQALLFWPY